jgi:hypothetical protein
LLQLTPLELLDHLAALERPPHLYRHRDTGALAPDALRAPPMLQQSLPSANGIGQRN